MNETLAVDVPAGHPPGRCRCALRRSGDEGSAWLPVEVDATSTPSRWPAADAATADKGTPAKVPASCAAC